MQVLRPNFEKRDGLVTVVAQDHRTGEVLMVAYTDLAGYIETLETSKAVYYSTSREKRWMKGEESGDVQEVASISVDCDGDALVYHITHRGDGACHTKAKSCFYRRADGTKKYNAPKAGEAEALTFIDVKAYLPS